MDLAEEMLRNRIATSVAKLIKLKSLKAILWVVLIGFALLFLGYGIHTSWNQLSQYKWSADFRFLFLSFALYPASLLPLLWGWHWIMSRLGEISDFGTNVKIYCYSCLPKHIPGVIWHIASRIYLYEERGVAYSVALLGTILETMILIVSGLLIYLLSLPIDSLGKTIHGLRVSSALLIVIPLGVVLHRATFNRVFGFLSKRFKCPAVVSMTQRDMSILLFIYSLAWIVGGMVLYLLANAVCVVPISKLPALIGIWAATGTVSLITSFVLSGPGAITITMSLLLGNYVPLPVAIVISLLFRILLTVGEVFWALVLSRLLR